MTSTLRTVGLAILVSLLVLARTARHTIEVLVDRLVVRSGVERRLADSIEVAFRHGGILPFVLRQLVGKH